MMRWWLLRLSISLPCTRQGWEMKLDMRIIAVCGFIFCFRSRENCVRVAFFNWQLQLHLQPKINSSLQLSIFCFNHSDVQLVFPRERLGDRIGVWESWRPKPNMLFHQLNLVHIYISTNMFKEQTREGTFPQKLLLQNIGLIMKGLKILSCGETWDSYMSTDKYKKT